MLYLALSSLCLWSPYSLNLSRFQLVPPAVLQIPLGRDFGHCPQPTSPEMTTGSEEDFYQSSKSLVLCFSTTALNSRNQMTENFCSFLD